jgi:hypothetical protein
MVACINKGLEEVIARLEEVVAKLEELVLAVGHRRTTKLEELVIEGHSNHRANHRASQPTPCATAITVHRTICWSRTVRLLELDGPPYLQRAA